MAIPEKHKDIHFPAGFLWGSSISAHQTEGDNLNDWTEWEKSERRLHDLEKRGLIGRHGKENFISGKAAGHYHRFQEDFRIAKELGHSAFRFSIEWSRIEPHKGEFNLKELGHYRERVQTLCDLGIEPFVTLWHWPVPLWVRDMGGWQSSQTPKYFARYAEKVVSALQNYVRFWITLNEPEIYASNSYLLGVWPPQKKNPILYLRVLHNLIAAHKKAFRVIKRIQPNSNIGIAKHNIHFEVHRNNAVNRTLKKLYDWWWNFYFLNQIKNFQDFIGVNQYFHHRIRWGKQRNKNEVVSDMEWELYPEAIYHVLKELMKYKKPIYITENGLADATDKLRGWFIHEVLTWVHRAIQEGADVRGYLHWSLLDNFEWDKGFWPRFGLVKIDYVTLARTPRPSARFYGKIASKNAITAEIIKNYKHLFN
jgi:beta-glucosidase